jgi:hypothetical protein
MRMTVWCGGRCTKPIGCPVCTVPALQWDRRRTTVAWMGLGACPHRVAVDGARWARNVHKALHTWQTANGGLCACSHRPAVDDGRCPPCEHKLCARRHSTVPSGWALCIISLHGAGLVAVCARRHSAGVDDAHGARRVAYVCPGSPRCGWPSCGKQALLHSMVVERCRSGGLYVPWHFTVADGARRRACALLGAGCSTAWLTACVSPCGFIDVCINANCGII